MKCNDCQHCNNKITPHQTVQVNGLSVYCPCVHLPTDAIEVTCKRFTQKAHPVDPALTQESTCGECGHLKDIEHHAPGKCAVHNKAKFPDDTACAKFKSKETAKPQLKASECPHRYRSVGAGNRCRDDEGNSCVCDDDDDACDVKQEETP